MVEGYVLNERRKFAYIGLKNKVIDRLLNQKSNTKEVTDMLDDKISSLEQKIDTFDKEDIHDKIDYSLMTAVSYADAAELIFKLGDKVFANEYVRKSIDHYNKALAELKSFGDDEAAKDYVEDINDRKEKDMHVFDMWNNKRTRFFKSLDKFTDYLKSTKTVSILEYYKSNFEPVSEDKVENNGHRYLVFYGHTNEKKNVALVMDNNLAESQLHSIIARINKASPNVVVRDLDDGEEASNVKYMEM